MEELARLVENIERVIRGKHEAVELVVTALAAGGHVLIEDVPGTGKTMLARALARSLDADFRRVQCTPDLLPSDVTGSSVWLQGEQRFEFRPGPVFANVLLVDEINRATPRTQSALLEAMEERQVSVDGHTHRLPEPFFLIATQNPIELAGTFPLPEAQLDRFLLQVSLGYPGPDEEVEVMAGQQQRHPIEQLEPVIDVGALLRARETVRGVHVHRSLLGYIQQLVAATRSSGHTSLGASPRGAVALMRAAQALAALRGDDFVTPDHVKWLAPAVLAHRLLLEPRARVEGLEGLELVRRLLEQVPVPVEVAPQP